jgi:hypothetical protein
VAAGPWAQGCLRAWQQQQQQAGCLQAQHLVLVMLRLVSGPLLLQCCQELALQSRLPQALLSHQLLRLLLLSPGCWLLHERGLLL